MRILVFGRSGQVATALARQQTSGHFVVCVGRPEADILDQQNISDHIEHETPNLVVNATAYTAVDKAETEEELAFSINRDAPLLIAQCCSAADIPFIHISTDYVFPGDKSEPYQPQDITGPQNAYGRSKLAGEVAVRDQAEKSIILRTAWVYDRTGSNFPRTMLRLAKTRDELGVVADQYGNPTDAEEIARAIMAIANTLEKSKEFSAWGIYHFTGPERMSWAAFARNVMDCSQTENGPFATIRDLTSEEFPTPVGRPANSSLDTASFTQTFGYKSATVQHSLKRAMPDWLK